ncbi:MAG: M20 aminoacylase family protein [Haliea sp.]
MERAAKEKDMPVVEKDSALHNKMTEWRHAFHMNPELAYDEYRTAELIEEVLIGANLEPTTGIGKTGIVATLKGQLGNGKSIGIRADMDALPMVELNKFNHRSRVDGRMHACGHDGHTAMLMGAAVALANNPQFFGEVHFIFQPAEEGAAGAKAMIDDGLFNQFPAQQVFSLHNWPKLKIGEAAVHEGPVMASYNTFKIRIHGKGCHAAMPHQGTDPILAMGHMITALNSIIGRNIDPLESGVISLTQVEGGQSYNVIPEVVELKGSVRTFSKEIQQLIKKRIEEIASSVGAAMNCDIEFEFQNTYPATINTENEVQICNRVLKSTVGISKVFTNLEPSMASEDFSYMLKDRGGTYIWLGSGRSDSAHGLHSPYYDFDDETLYIGANYWVGLVYELLGKRS